jgi:hypothetical protein
MYPISMIKPFLVQKNLSQKLEENDLPDTREAMLKAIASGSVISWLHINLFGEYDFSEERLQDSLKYAFRLSRRYPVCGQPDHL